jgi:hypothetical protein
MHELQQNLIDLLVNKNLSVPGKFQPTFKKLATWLSDPNIKISEDAACVLLALLYSHISQLNVRENVPIVAHFVKDNKLFPDTKKGKEQLQEFLQLLFIGWPVEKILAQIQRNGMQATQVPKPKAK